MSAAAIHSREETEFTIKQVGTTVTILSGPYNEHNFMVQNANCVIDYNDDVFTDAKKLYKVFPFGRGSGFLGCVTLLVYYAVLIGGIFMIVAGRLYWVSSQTHGIMIGVALFLAIYHLVGVIIIYINGHRFFDKMYFIEVRALQTANDFLLIEANTRTTVSIIAVDRSNALAARLQQSGRAAIKVMVYTQRYHSAKYTAPKVKFYLIFFIHLIATLMNIFAYIHQRQQT